MQQLAALKTFALSFETGWFLYQVSDMTLFAACYVPVRRRSILGILSETHLCSLCYLTHIASFQSGHPMPQDIFDFWSQIRRGEKIHPADKQVFRRMNPERHCHLAECH
jgi:hypothetical protein